MVVMFKMSKDEMKKTIEDMKSVYPDNLPKKKKLNLKKYKVTMELWVDGDKWSLAYLKKCNLVLEDGLISKKQKFEEIKKKDS